MGIVAIFINTFYKTLRYNESGVHIDCFIYLHVCVKCFLLCNFFDIILKVKRATLHCCSDTAQATFWQATNSPCLAYGQASVSYIILKVLLRD